MKRAFQSPRSEPFAILAAILTLNFFMPRWSAGEEKAEKPGKVTITVTWKEKEPDTGSVVLLVPEALKVKIDGSVLTSSDPDFDNEMIERAVARARKAGAYRAVVGGNAKATFNRVPPGNYLAVIHSAKTRWHAREHDDISKLTCPRFLVQGL